MPVYYESPYLEMLKNRIDLVRVPFTERGSRLLVMRKGDLLTVRFVERWYKADPTLSGYRERPPILEGFVFTDGEGQPLDYTLETYPDHLDFHTPVGIFAMTFADMETLLIALPEQACGVRFTAHANNAETDRRGGILHVTGNIRRNIAYTTNRPISTNRMEPDGEGIVIVDLQLQSGPVTGLLFNLTPRLGFNRYVPRVKAVFEAAARRWHEWFAVVPPVGDAYLNQYLYAWWVMRAGLISTRFYTTREAMTPSKIHYIGIWQWDAYFHALAYRHIDQRLAADQLRIVLDHQRADGMLPDAIHDEGTVTHLTVPVEADVTKPPLLAWAAWKMYQDHHDREFLDEIYEPIMRWNRWWFEQNDLDHDGLCEYQHPFSSGLDDSPLWDAGMPVASPDLNTYLYLQMEDLARIAGVLGLPEDQAHWQSQCDLLFDRMMSELWDPQSGVFWARKGGEFIKILTPFSLFPLLTGRLPVDIANRLVERLTDPALFWTRYPVPTVAINEPTYNPMQMWRGPVWINVNYLLIEGLERSGFTDLANELRTRTLDLLMNQGDICEYYHPETGAACATAAPTFGWSAALFIDLALQASRVESVLGGEPKE